MGHHDVRRLYVAMNGLLGVHILHRVKQLGGNLARLFFCKRSACDGCLKILAVYIFHDDALAKFFYRLHAYGATDVGMIELQAYFKLLHERLTIYGREGEVGLQTLQHIALAVSHGREQARKTRLRDIYFANVRKAAVVLRAAEAALTAKACHES